MSDIVEDLKECAKYAHEYPSDRDLLKGAAKEITRLREELTSAKRAAEAYEAWKFPEDIQALTVENERLRAENARLREERDLLHAILTNVSLSMEAFDVNAAIREGATDE